MALKVTKTELWTVAIEDRAGGTVDKLEPLAKAGANFEFVFARRTPEQPGRGVLFAAPVKGAKLVRAAQAAGFVKSTSIHSIRMEGGDKAGLGAKVMRALADAGISFRALSATTLGRKFVGYVALDSADDAARAASLIRKLG